MIRRKGDMLTEVGAPNTIVFITTNNIVKSNGALVMGAGIAKRVRDNYPGSDLVFGHWIKVSGNSPYGLLYREEADIGIFQTKDHYKDDADIGIIELSVTHLTILANEHSHATFHLNYPGIGKGNLSKDVVAPLLEPLPDNVHVWTFD